MKLSDQNQDYGKGKTGKCAGQLILTYEDADGKSNEEEIKFDSEIKETQIKSLKVEDDQEKTNNWWYSIDAVVTALLISIILILVRKLHFPAITTASSPVHSELDFFQTRSYQVLKKSLFPYNLQF